MTIQDLKPQLLSLLYETLKATAATAAAVTTTIQKTTKATTLINDYYNESDNNLTETPNAIATFDATAASLRRQTSATTTTTTLYELVDMSSKTTTLEGSSRATTSTSTTANNLLPKPAFLYATQIPSIPTPAYHWENVTLSSNSSSSSSSTSLVVDLVESLTSLENLTNSLVQSIESTSTPTHLSLSGNFTWDASSTATSITISTTRSNSHTANVSATLPPFVDSYLVGMAWTKALVVAIFMLLILVTVVGNTLVILAVLTTRRLRTVTNCFVLNLAITDWLVGTCVMPPAVIHYIAEGVWRFGWILCDIWISLDVLLCTASILSLCAISLDRYLAVTQPLTYSKNRRTKRLALVMIFIVWVTALSITCPPYLGWYETGRRDEGYTVCRYNQNKGYVVFSGMGSFFIPLSVMLYVYLKIGYVLTSRRQRIVRDANSERTADHEIDCDNFLSESEHFQCGPHKFGTFKSRWTLDSANNSKTNSLKCSKCNKNYIDQNSLKHQASFYELVEISRLSVQTTVLPPVATCTSINCRYGDGTCTTTAATTNVTFTIGDSLSQRGSTLPLQQLHCTDSRTSFSETCLAQAMTQIGKYATNGQQQPHAQQLHINNVVQHPGHHSHVQNQHSHHGHHHQHHHHHHHHHRVPMRVSTTKRDPKTAKTLTIVMGGFIACWLPFFVYYILIPFLPPAAVCEGLITFLTWVGWVNCAINPFIYAFYNPDFRTAFWRLTCKRICKQKSPANHMTMFRG